MKNLTGTVLTLGVLTFSCFPVFADDDRNSGSSSQAQTQNQQQNQTTNNANTNSNQLSNTSSSNSINTISTSSSATGGNTSSTSNNNSSASSGSNSSTNTNSYNNLQYPDWVNVAPSQSSVGIDAVVCQGTTLTGGVSTLTTSIDNNRYGVQGTLGFSVPLTGQDDCRAISAAIKKRASIENASRTLLACHQLKLAGITPDLTKFPELDACN
jgi:cytoskeletal protein RodZ